ncbi:MAG: beta-lactamase family protein [Planctomycetales bacterium]|nr:beta-lactamase family protein [Planctomycetales bacterium]
MTTNQAAVNVTRITRCVANRISDLTLAVVVICAHTAHAAEAPTAERIKRLLPPHVGAAVLAIDDGQVVFKHAWGRRRYDRDDLCSPTTNFRLASVTKHVTATAILLLADRGALTLDDTLDKFFPECPDYWRHITVRHLLTHTSGLPDYENLIPDGTTLQLTDLNVLALLRATNAPLFAPGAKFAYSNSGYTLLGLIVETAGRRPFHDFVATELFQPVGMNRSVMYVAGINAVAERAYGHEPAGDDKWTLADQSLTSAVRGDGGVYSSLDDLQRWLAALDERTLLAESTYEAMESPQVKTDRGDAEYGYGWFLDEYRGERRIYHAGSTRGFSLHLTRFPDRRAAVAILLNRSGIAPDDDYVDRVVDSLLFEEHAD